MGGDAMVWPCHSGQDLASDGHAYRTTAPLEAGDSCHRHWLADCWLVLLPSARLGHTHQLHHGIDGLSNGVFVDAHHGRKAVAAMALDDFLDVVHSGWVLLAVLAFQKPGGTCVDARGQCPGISFALLDVRDGLVLPGYAARHAG